MLHQVDFRQIFNKLLKLLVSLNNYSLIGQHYDHYPMKVSQTLFSSARADTWNHLDAKLAPEEAHLVLAFGLRASLEKPDTYEALKAHFPNAQIAMASTAGNLANDLLQNDHTVCSAVSFDKSEIQCSAATFKEGSSLDAICQQLSNQLSAQDGLRHVFILSDGGTVNGTTLSQSFNQHLPQGVTLSGGLAGDGTDFNETVVGLNETPQPGRIVAIGLYGDSLSIQFGSSGGWSTFGPERIVTKSDGNVLYELDGKPALELYKTYLGEEAEHLPAAALRFPLCVNPRDNQPPVVRTILTIDEAEGSMTFAGDIQPDASVHFMRASYEDLIEGAQTAAREAEDKEADLVICVSCVGRRIVLGQRTEEELECVRDVFGSKPTIAGFYSYGELAPTSGEKHCQLHNQTMTLTSIRER